MSELLSAVAATLGAPEELIRRSADARAAAQGIDADQVLQAWAGGAAPVGSAVVRDSVVEVPQPVAAPDPLPVEVGDSLGVEPSEPITAVATAVLEPEAAAAFDVDPAPLASRLPIPMALGAAIGAVFGLFTAGMGAVFFIDNVATVEHGDGFRAVVEVEVVPVIVGVALLSAIFGAFLGVLGRHGPASFRSELSVVGGPGIWFGALIGTLLGAIGGGMLVGVLGIETLEEQIVAVPVASAAWWLVIGGAVLGAITSLLSHITAVPAGLSNAEYADSGEVRTRLGQSLMMPLATILVLIVVIAVIATLFLVFHEAAAMLAIVISAGILLFAFLGGYRPSIKLRYTEVVAALAGVATVVLAIVMVVVVRGH